MQGVLRGIGVFAAATLLALLGAGAAYAGSVRYAGQSSQGKKVVMRTDSRGVPKRFTIATRANCRGGDPHIRGGTSFLRPFDRATPKRFNDFGHYTNRYDDHVVGRFTVGVAGSRDSATRFHGTFRLKAVFSQRGERYATCRLKHVRWTATHH
ncbi:MAG: hypothetical protein U0R51_06005 [Solirubrobacterales bacterium]